MKLQLTPGVNRKSPSKAEEAERIQTLRDTVEHYLRDGVAAVKGCKEKDMNLILHQDAFCAGYDMDEYTLLGMFIKYAGLSGVAVQIIGTNHETFGD